MHGASNHDVTLQHSLQSRQQVKGGVFIRQRRARVLKKKLPGGHAGTPRTNSPNQQEFTGEISSAQLVRPGPPARGPVHLTVASTMRNFCLYPAKKRRSRESRQRD
jgi:hypothetical protein